MPLSSSIAIIHRSQLTFQSSKYNYDVGEALLNKLRHKGTSVADTVSLHNQHYHHTLVMLRHRYCRDISSRLFWFCHHITAPFGM
jgi:hypothetical protein